MRKTYLPKAPEAPKANKPRRVFNTVPLEVHLARSPHGFDCLQLEEPALIFAGNQRCVDPRTGMVAYGPYFKAEGARPRQLRVGIVGTFEGIEQTLRLLDEISMPVEQDKNVDCILHPSFPGLNSAAPFETDVVTKPDWHRRIHGHDLLRAMESCDDPRVKRELLQDCFGRELRELGGLPVPPDVALCAISKPLAHLVHSQPNTRATRSTAMEGKSGAGRDSAREKSFRKFQSALSVESLSSIPSQLLWDEVLGPPLPGSDRATQAWNISLALFYKTGLAPWRLADADNQSCHIGISFFRSPEDSSPRSWTSFAHVFTESGENFVVTGDAVACHSAAKRAGEPHLDEKQSAAILKSVLTTYKAKFGASPGKVVIHRTSAYSESERAGFKTALEKIGKYALVTLTRRGVFVLRPGRKPVLRGTAIPFGEKLGLVFTSGYVPFLQCYPGERLPQPLETVENWGSISFSEIATDMLRLTKLNMCSPQFYSEDPVPCSYSRQIREILEVSGRKPSVIDGKYCI
jgi:hypothetical protein